MNFGVFTMFNIREGATQAQTFTEWLKVVQEAEMLGMDVFWLGESLQARPSSGIVPAYGRKRGRGTHKPHENRDCGAGASSSESD